MVFTALNSFFRTSAGEVNSLNKLEANRTIGINWKF
jgi:hypothetical protein